jgi:hypothetical protein
MPSFCAVPLAEVPRFASVLNSTGRYLCCVKASNLYHACSFIQGDLIKQYILHSHIGSEFYFNIILFYQLPGCLFSSDFSTKTSSVFLISPLPATGAAYLLHSN